jgi:hypothetical protein
MGMTLRLRLLASLVLALNCATALPAQSIRYGSISQYGVPDEPSPAPASLQRTTDIFPVRDSPPESLTPVKPVVKKERFHWGPALTQSFIFLSIEQGVLFASDQYALQSTEGKFFEGWGKAIQGIRSWDDGDPLKDNYVGHPMQGAITGYIQVQNDPAGRRVVFGKSRQYWKSRLKATAWSAVYSAQFEIGPVSEASIRKLGSYEYRNCSTCKRTTGMGYVDFVITPVLGLGWMMAEDAGDRFLVRRYEQRHGLNFWAKFMRAGLSPSRSAANILRWKKPWFRDDRDVFSETTVGDPVKR